MTIGSPGAGISPAAGATWGATPASSPPPQQTLYSVGIATVALGVACGMLDAFSI